VVRIKDEFFGNDLDKPVFDGAHGFSGGEAGAVGDAENMRIDGHGGLTKRGVEYHIGRFAPHAGECFEFGARLWHFTLVFFEQQAAQTHHIFGLGLIQANGLDKSAQALFAQVNDGLRGVGDGEEAVSRKVPPLSVAWAESTTATSSSNTEV